MFMNFSLTGVTAVAVPPGTPAYRQRARGGATPLPSTFIR